MWRFCSVLSVRTNGRRKPNTCVEQEIARGVIEGAVTSEPTCRNGLERWHARCEESRA